MAAVSILGGSKATAQLVGENVVVLAFVCPTPASAERLIGRWRKRLERRTAAIAARTPVAPPADPFAPGSRVRVIVYAWESGERALDCTVLRPLPDGRLLVRTRMGEEHPIDRRDLRPGWSAR